MIAHSYNKKNKWNDNPILIGDLTLPQEIQETILKSKWKIDNFIWIDEKQRIKQELAINAEFWELIVLDKELLKKYLDLTKKIQEKNIILKSIFIKILKIKNSDLKNNAKLVSNIFKYFETENIIWYRKYIFKIFSNKKEKIENKWFTLDTIDNIFDILDLFEKIFTKKI